LRKENSATIKGFRQEIWTQILEECRHHVESMLSEMQPASTASFVTEAMEKDFRNIL